MAVYISVNFHTLLMWHILFTKPEASGEGAIWETVLGSKDRPGKLFN